MAEIKFTLTTENVNKLISALCAHYNYQETITDELGKSLPNPETRAAFSKRMIMSFMKDHVRAYAIEEARAAAEAAANTNIDIG